MDHMEKTAKNSYQGFLTKGNWYKGNLHSHTTNSDGNLRPEEAVKQYKEKGYHFLCFSEHDRYTDYRETFNTKDFIILPGLEASAILLEKKGSRNCLRLHHIHGILGNWEMQEKCKDALFNHGETVHPPIYYGTWDGEKVAQDLVDYLTERGCITTYNHPIWSRVEEKEFTNVNGIFGLEIFNYNTVNECALGYDVTYWDVMLRNGKQIHGFASDDNHNNGMFDDSFGGFVMVQAESLSHENIINSLLQGNFYSSMGPKIQEFEIRDGKVVVSCDPVERINFIVGGYVGAGTTVLNQIGCNDVTNATYPLNGSETYVRVECKEASGKTAWSNAIFL